MIKSQIPEWTPTTFKSDFEKAAMNAISTVFRNIVIKGCYFHFSQAVWKKGKQLNLTNSINLISTSTVTKRKNYGRLVLCSWRKSGRREQWQI